jgi:hypothetical protein
MRNYFNLSNISLYSILFFIFPLVISSAYGASVTVTLEPGNGLQRSDLNNLVVQVNFNQDIRQQSVGQTLSAFFDGVPNGVYKIEEIKTLDGDNVRFEQPNGDLCRFNIQEDSQNDFCQVTIINLDDNGNNDNEGEGLSLPGATELLNEVLDTVTIRLLSENDDFSDPPFKICQEFRTPLGDPSNSVTLEDFVVVRTPSSATYTIDGEVSIQQLRDMLKKYNPVIEIRITNDLHMTDNHPINDLTSSKYKGEVVFFKDGLEVDTLPFKIDKIDTDCTFITMVESIKPLGKTGDITTLNKEGVEQFKKNGNFDMEDDLNDKFLVGGPTLVRQPTRDTPIIPVILNSPFGPCNQVVTSLAFQDDNDLGEETDDFTQLEKSEFAKYKISGKFAKIPSKDSTNNIQLRMISDLVPNATDAAKITDNNNRYINLDLILNPNQQSAKAVDFEIKKVAYDCTGVGFDR